MGAPSAHVKIPGRQSRQQVFYYAIRHDYSAWFKRSKQSTPLQVFPRKNLTFFFWLIRFWSSCSRFEYRRSQLTDLPFYPWPLVSCNYFFTNYDIADRYNQWTVSASAHKDWMDRRGFLLACVLTYSALLLVTHRPSHGSAAEEFAMVVVGLLVCWWQDRSFFLDFIEKNVCYLIP